ncbi:hypothetical protein [Intestinibacter sp.]
MNFVEKKPILLHELQESRTLNRFEIVENSETRLCLYTLQKVYGMKSPCEIRLFMLSGNPFTVVTYSFMKGKDSDYPIELLEFLNEYNEKSEELKFYINNENSVVGELVYAHMEDSFDSEELVEHIKYGIEYVSRVHQDLFKRFF